MKVHFHRSGRDEDVDDDDDDDDCGDDDGDDACFQTHHDNTKYQYSKSKPFQGGTRGLNRDLSSIMH